MHLDTKCNCCCRQTCRFLVNAQEIGFTGTINNISIDQLKMIWEEHNSLGYQLNFDEILASYITFECALSLFDMLKECQCCNRHSLNRPEVLF